MPNIALKSICLVSLNNCFLQLIDLNMIICCYYILYREMIFSDYFLIIDKIALSFNSLVLFLFFWYLLYIVKKHHFGYCFSLLFIISACSNHLSLFKLQHLKL